MQLSKIEERNKTFYFNIFNPFMLRELFHPYELDESVCQFRGVWLSLILSLDLMEKYSFVLCKCCRPSSDTVFRGVWSGHTLFAFYGTLGIKT